MLRSINHRHFVVTFSTILSAVLGAGSAIAQTPESYGSNPPGPFHQPVPPLPVELGFTQDHASTAAEGYLRGKAAVIQALGNYQLSESQAEILREQARWLNRENDLQQTAALLAQKKMWDDARIKARKDRNAQLAEGRQIANEREATVYRQAYQLSCTDIDFITGEINWPVGLKSPRFAGLRDNLQKLVQQHLAYGDAQPEAAIEIARSAGQWSQSLRREISTLPRDEYTAAQKFLTALKYTAAAKAQNVAKSQPTGSQPVTAKLANQ
jgi:hypothetical protein